jgi:hypothetical protein
MVNWYSNSLSYCTHNMNAYKYLNYGGKIFRSFL